MIQPSLLWSVENNTLIDCQKANGDQLAAIADPVVNRKRQSERLHLDFALPFPL